jgi:CheY-like chemotaxis protein
MADQPPQQQPAFLYVEDHPASRLVMQLVLKDLLGYEDLTMFEDSRDILQHLEASGKTFDVIFLDLHVDPLDGYEVLKLLRQHEKFAASKVVVLTASMILDEVDQVHAAGFDGLISKPINLDSFGDFVKRILAGEAVWETN